MQSGDTQTLKRLDDTTQQTQTRKGEVMMKRFKSWNDWEAAVEAGSKSASIRDKFDLMIGAAGLMASQSTDVQHTKFLALALDVESEMKSILCGGDSLEDTAAKLVER